jgi:hypothetical protein
VPATGTSNGNGSQPATVEDRRSEVAPGPEALAEPAESGGVTFDPVEDIAESAFRAEARARGESVAPTSRPATAAEPIDTQPLPPLEQLVERIPAEVREALDDLFRAKFVTVRRVPDKALKT